MAPVILAHLVFAAPLAAQSTVPVGPSAPVLRAEPNPAAPVTSFERGTTRLIWATGDGRPGRLRVFTGPDSPGRVVASGRRGVTTVSWIANQSSYDFRLYGNDRPEIPLASVSVTCCAEPIRLGRALSLAGLVTLLVAGLSLARRRAAPADRLDTVAAVALFTAAWATYLYLGARIAETGVLSRWSLLFDTDTLARLNELAFPRASHVRTTAHPLFALLFNPAGTVLRRVLGSAELAAIFLSSAFGAAGAALAFRLFRRAGLTRVRAVLFAAALAGSSAHLFFASIPETYIFTATALIAMCLVTVGPQARLWKSIAVGVFAAGMLVTSPVTTACLYASGLSRATWIRRIDRATAFVLIVVTITAALGLLQSALYPTSRHSLSPRTVSKEDATFLVIPGGAGALARRAGWLAESMLLYNIVAPTPVVDHAAVLLNPQAADPRFPRVRFTPASISSFGVVGSLAAAFWIALVFPAARGLLRNPGARSPVVLGMLASLAGVVALHMVYGADLFLYSPTWTFLVIALVALGDARTPAAGHRLRMLLPLFVGLQLANNIRFVMRIADLYR